jgi:hypothetical protein
LIGMARRLLREPQRWHDLQVRNHISTPRRIPLGATIRIPYSWLRMSPESAFVSAVSGTAALNGAAIRSGEALAQGSLIETGTDGSVTLDLADGSIVMLQKSSSLKLDEMQRVSGVDDAHDNRLLLQSGRLQLLVKPQRDAGRFEIVTPVAVSAVRGTQFRTSFDGRTDHATTETLDGHVAVAGSAAEVALPAGFGTRVERDAPPLAPVKLLPPPDLAAVPDVTTGERLQLQWTAVSGAEAYRIQLAPDADFHSITADALSPSATVALPAPTDGLYWLRVRSIDRFGLEGLDAVKSMSQHLLPAAPTPISPLSGTRIEGERTVFAWAGAASDSRFRLQLSRDPEFEQPVLEREITGVSSLELDALAPGNYFWRVAAVNTRGESGDWSVTRAYAQRPSPPMPPAPEITAHELQLHWDAQPDAQYRIQIARDPSFQRIWLERALNAPALSIARPFPGTYYVRVQSIGADGEAAAFGPPRQFKVPVPPWLKILLPFAAVLAVIR